MPYCPNCGVELEDGIARCPLCGANPVPFLSNDERVDLATRTLESRREGASGEFADGKGPGDEELAHERNTLRWEAVSVSTAISAVAVCAVNLLTTGNLSWALYPLASLAFIWIELSTLVELRAKPALGLPLALAALPAYLFALDIVDGRLDWAWPVGVPIALVVEISFGMGLLIAARLGWRALLTISLLLLAAALTCIGIDGSLSLSLAGRLRLSWSGVVAAALVPVAGFLVYIHFRVLKVARLRRLFRM